LFSLCVFALSECLTQIQNRKFPHLLEFLNAIKVWRWPNLRVSKTHLQFKKPFMLYIDCTLKFVLCIYIYIYT